MNTYLYRFIANENMSEAFYGFFWDEFRFSILDRNQIDNVGSSVPKTRKQFFLVLYIIRLYILNIKLTRTPNSYRGGDKMCCWI